jgi:quercetin dioxygenase-like cupin family protein
MFRGNAVYLCGEEIQMKLSLSPALAAMIGVTTVFGLGAVAQEKKDGTTGHGIVRPADLKWTPIIKGCELASVDGDMNAEGTPFVLRLRCAAGTKIPAHWHPTDERLTVVKGTFQVGIGEKFDTALLQSMNAGDFASMPKEVRHFALSKTATIVQVHATGPFKVNWVNPAEVMLPETKPVK